MIKKIIINADDFGHTMGVSYGITDAHLNGVVTSTTALSVASCFGQSMEKVKFLAPKLGIGVHLALTLKGAKPLLKLPSLCNEQGFFHSLAEAPDKVCPDEVKLEWEAQILKFISTGHYPTHFDSHHHVHMNIEGLLEVMEELAAKFGVPIRHPGRETKALSTCEMLGDFYDENANQEFLNSMLDKIAESENEYFELCVHPAFVDGNLQRLTSYSTPRIGEHMALTSCETKKKIAEKGFLLTNFKGLVR